MALGPVDDFGRREGDARLRGTGWLAGEEGIEDSASRDTTVDGAVDGFLRNGDPAASTSESADALARAG